MVKEGEGRGKEQRGGEWCRELGVGCKVLVVVVVVTAVKANQREDVKKC